MTADIRAYLQEFSSQPFMRGLSDCCALAAGWIALRTGKPVEHPGLGRPLTDAEAAKVVGDHGGSVGAIARKVLNQAGWRMREGEPHDGDVIIAERAQSSFPCFLGIWSNGHLVTTGRHGMRMVSRQDLLEIECWSYGD